MHRRSGFSSVKKSSESQMPNTKWFDKLTTTLSMVEGQITIINIQKPKQLVSDLDWKLEFIWNLVLVICYFRIIRLRDQL
jgi:hypothetical protein